MHEDPIVEEVRRVRAEHAAAFGHDLRKIYENFKEEEKRSGGQVVSLPPKRPTAVLPQE